MGADADVPSAEPSTDGGFEAAAAYDGPRAGKVFQMGHRGLGYYPDPAMRAVGGSNGVRGDGIERAEVREEVRKEARTGGATDSTGAVGRDAGRVDAVIGATAVPEKPKSPEEIAAGECCGGVMDFLHSPRLWQRGVIAPTVIAKTHSGRRFSLSRSSLPCRDQGRGQRPLPGLPFRRCGGILHPRPGRLRARHGRGRRPPRQPRRRSPPPGSPRRRRNRRGRLRFPGPFLRQGAPPPGRGPRRGRHGGVRDPRPPEGR